LRRALRRSCCRERWFRAPLKRLDPEHLRDERRDVDLGTDESAFSPVDHAESAEHGESVVDESTAGAIPPAR
jgi:hypothetical protein